MSIPRKRLPRRTIAAVSGRIGHAAEHNIKVIFADVTEVIAVLITVQVYRLSYKYIHTGCKKITHADFHLKRYGLKMLQMLPFFGHTSGMHPNFYGYILLRLWNINRWDRDIMPLLI